MLWELALANFVERGRRDARADAHQGNFHPTSGTEPQADFVRHASSRDQGTDRWYAHQQGLLPLEDTAPLECAALLCKLAPGRQWC